MESSRLKYADPSSPRVSHGSSVRTTPRRTSASQLSTLRCSIVSPSVLKTPSRQSVSSHFDDEAFTPLVSPHRPLNITTSSGPICRICHEGDQNIPLISVCLCSGTVGLVHLPCIEHWLSASNSDHCEICHYRYAIERHPRPFKDWLFKSGRGIKRSFLGDVACFALLTPLAGVSGMLCFHGAARQSAHRNLWEAVGLLLLAVLLFAVYAVWSTLTFRYHYRCWKRWQIEHPSVTIVRLTRNPGAVGEEHEQTPGPQHTLGSPVRQLGESSSPPRQISSTSDVGQRNHAEEQPTTPTREIYDAGPAGQHNSTWL